MGGGELRAQEGDWANAMVCYGSSVGVGRLDVGEKEVRWVNLLVFHVKRHDSWGLDDRREASLNILASDSRVYYHGSVSVNSANAPQYGSLFSRRLVSRYEIV